MRILSSSFIKKAKIPIINIHPSLLPKFKGLNTHERAIKSKQKISGCTVHYVSEKLDSGKIILQKKVKILKKDNPKTLASKVLKLEHEAYSEALNLIIN
jgi:phosphoribosylglycinamide formyltransferase-1